MCGRAAAPLSCGAVLVGIAHEQAELGAAGNYLRAAIRAVLSRFRVDELTPVTLPPGRFRLATSQFDRVAACHENDRNCRGRRLAASAASCRRATITVDLTANQFGGQGR